MSVAKSLRTFLIGLTGHSIGQVAQQVIPSNFNTSQGFIWFARRSTTPVRTLAKASGLPEQQFFDLEVYHPDPDVTENFADVLQSQDGYRGVFGAGRIQAFFVDSQSDDYVPQIGSTDTEHLASSFLSIEVRSYRE